MNLESGRQPPKETARCCCSVWNPRESRRPAHETERRNTLPQAKSTAVSREKRVQRDPPASRRAAGAGPEEAQRKPATRVARGRLTVPRGICRRKAIARIPGVTVREAFGAAGRAFVQPAETGCRSRYEGLLPLEEKGSKYKQV